MHGPAWLLRNQSRRSASITSRVSTESGESHPHLDAVVHEARAIVDAGFARG